MRGARFPKVSTSLKLWLLRKINPEFPHLTQVKTSLFTIILCLLAQQFLRLYAFSVLKVGARMSDRRAEIFGIFAYLGSALMHTVLNLLGIESRLLVLVDGLDYGVLAEPNYVPEVINEKIVALAGSPADPLPQIKAMKLNCTVGEEFGRLTVWNWEHDRLPWREAHIY